MTKKKPATRPNPIKTKNLKNTIICPVCSKRIPDADYPHHYEACKEARLDRMARPISAHPVPYTDNQGGSDVHFISGGTPGCGKRR